ncbi:MAG: hypothetical protein NZ528_01760 [Caldilineales bacterium]|nr:hypothetical protein [Caldilineales bacterium]MDW8316318.1 hypothetical protein [Anaerolineae bacterium]
MNRWKVAWQRLRGQSCDTCRFAEVFRSNGDGQVTRLHTFCRGPQSPYHDRPAPAERWCEAWERLEGPRTPPRVGDPTLTA